MTFSLMVYPQLWGQSPISGHFTIGNLGDRRE
jgi:hypothetical protein